MVYIKPFRALRPKEDLVSKVNSPPYDIISKEEARSVIEHNPYSFLKVVKPETTIQEAENISDSQLAEIAARNLQEMIRQKIFLQDENECFYLYSQSNEIYQRMGLVVCLSAEDYLKGIIKKHENINTETYQQRVSHIMKTKTHTGCILVLYKSNGGIEELLKQEAGNKKPIYEFESEDGIKNCCWQIQKKEIIFTLIKAFQDISSLYIADGHHRAAAAVEVARLLKSQQKKSQDNEKKVMEEYMYFPAVLIPDNQIHISAYHRVVRIPLDFNKDDFINRLAQIFKIEKISPNHPFLPSTKHEFGMNMSGQWYRLLIKEGILHKEESDITSRLDVSILQEMVLHPLLGIKYPQQNNVIEFIGGVNSLLKIEERIEQEAVIVFTLFPTSVEDVIEISEMEKIMPPKSTWFTPKLRSGIFVHYFG